VTTGSSVLGRLEPGKSSIARHTDSNKIISVLIVVITVLAILIVGGTILSVYLWYLTPGPGDRLE